MKKEKKIIFDKKKELYMIKKGNGKKKGAKK